MSTDKYGEALGCAKNSLATKPFFARKLPVFPVIPVFPEPGLNSENSILQRLDFYSRSGYITKNLKPERIK